MNIEKRVEFDQVCIWPGTIVEETEKAKFEEFMLETFNARIQFLETIYTKPDKKNGQRVVGTGGRRDVFFAVHNRDVGNFAIPRLAYDIRWIEDAISPVNGGNRLYPTRVHGYKSW